MSQFLKAGQSVSALRPGDTLSAVLDRVNDASQPVLPVVDAENRLLGVVNLEEVYLAAHADHMQSLILAADLMSTDVHPLQPDDPLDRAMELFVENDLLVLPVVDDLRQQHVLGMVRRFDISSAYVRRLHGPADSAPSDGVP